VTGGTEGVGVGFRLKIVDSVVTGHSGPGIRSPIDANMRILRTDVSGNGEDGIQSPNGPGRLTVKESTITNNALDGILFFGRMKIISGSTVTGNGLNGINSGDVINCENVTVRDSILTGNGIDASCGVAQTCADVATCDFPSLSGTTCDTSYDTGSGFPGTNWGVCALD
jgi:hypothetical protein